MLCTSDPATLTFQATVHFTIPHTEGTLSYRWIRSDGASGTVRTMHIAADRATQTFSETWTLGALGSNQNLWERLIVSTPATVYSNKAVARFSASYCFFN